MLDIIDLILQIVATASLFIVTMLSFDPIKKAHRILDSKRTLYISLLVMWSSGISLIFVEHHSNSIEKMKTSMEKDTALKYQKETIGSLKNQMLAEKTYQQKADYRHVEDSTNYANSLFMVKNSIENGNSYLETPFITINKLPVYTLHNPNKPYYTKEEAASSKLVFEIRNNSKVLAQNIEYGYWLFWQKEDGSIHIDSMSSPYERDRTKSVLLGNSVEKLEEYTTFTDFLPSKLHFRHIPPKKEFYLYFKLLYTNKQNIQHPPLRRIYSVEFANTDTAQILFHSYIKEVDDYTYNQNVEILEKLHVW